MAAYGAVTGARKLKVADPTAQEVGTLNGGTPQLGASCGSAQVEVER